MPSAQQQDKSASEKENRERINPRRPTEAPPRRTGTASAAGSTVVVRAVASRSGGRLNWASTSPPPRWRPTRSATSHSAVIARRRRRVTSSRIWRDHDQETQRHGFGARARAPAGRPRCSTRRTARKKRLGGRPKGVENRAVRSLPEVGRGADAADTAPGRRAGVGGALRRVAFSVVARSTPSSSSTSRRRGDSLREVLKRFAAVVRATQSSPWASERRSNSLMLSVDDSSPGVLTAGLAPST